MSNTYTGKRQIWEQKFTYYGKLSNTSIIQTVPGVEVNRIIQKPYESVIQDKIVEYKQPLIDNSSVNNNIDKDLLNFKILEETPFSNTNPYKFINQITLRIDKITIQTYNFYDPLVPNKDRTLSTTYEQLTQLLPLQIKINNKEIEFGAADGINEYSIAEIGYNYGTNTPIIEQVLNKGNTYLESYEKDFELASFPQKIDVEINFNNNILTSYLNNSFFRNFFYNNNINDRIDRSVYLYSSIDNIRIDGRIISNIDYDSMANMRLNAPTRAVETPITLNNIEGMLKKVIPKKEKKDKNAKRKIEFKTTTKEEAQKIIDQFFDDKVEQFELTDIIQTIKENAEIIYN